MLITLPEPPAQMDTDLRQSFLTLLPVLTAQAHDAFRFLRHFHDREDAVADVIAQAWEIYATAPSRRTLTAQRLAEQAVHAVWTTRTPTPR